MVEFQDENNYSPPTNSSAHCNVDTNTTETATTASTAMMAPDGDRLATKEQVDSKPKETETPKRRAKTYPPPLTASLVKKSKLKLYTPAPREDLVLISDEEDDEESATAATQRLLAIFGKSVPSNHQSGRTSKADKEKLLNTTNPSASTSKAICRELRIAKALNQKSLKRIRSAHTKVEGTAKLLSSSPSSMGGPFLPITARVQPSRAPKRSEVEVESKVSRKKRRTPAPKKTGRKRKIKAHEEKDEEPEEPTRDTKKFRGELNLSEEEEEGTPNPASGDPEPCGEAEATDEHNQEEPQPGDETGDQVQNETMTDDGGEGNTPITSESSMTTTNDMGPSQSETEEIEGMEVPRGNEVKKRPGRSRQRGRKAKTASGQGGDGGDGETPPPPPAAEVRKSGRVRHPPRTDEYWVYAFTSSGR